MTPPVVRSVAVVGGGLVGGSIAAAARDAGVPDVRITDHDASVRDRARARSWGHLVHDDLASTVRGAEVVFLAVPTHAVADVAVVVAPLLPDDGILTDAASLKGDLTLDVESRLRVSNSRPAVGRFLGGHPMAGSERNGPEAAHAQLFVAATWVLTPTAATDDDVLPRLSALLRSFGARVVALPPVRHDELVAVVSHLPQVAASALAAIAADAMDATGDAVLSVAGGGFRDTTRIAASDPALWEPILRGNRTAVLEVLRAYVGQLQRLERAVEEGRFDEVHAVLERGSIARRRLVPKADVDETVELVVPLDDQPGQLADAMTALGEAAVNVEDVAMRHTVEGARRGVLLITVAAGVGAMAEQVLRDAGLAPVRGAPPGEDPS
ncbi:MAG: prephenate dehydrogenase/arogenate dehydrogenase family protein [Nitriliruptoraceae bacterium]|nr:prephenate dehydrogenase/arogenate dehydrogenase family protein [Nitriliruptoraceae bacterium]